LGIILLWCAGSQSEQVDAFGSGRLRTDLVVSRGEEGNRKKGKKKKDLLKTIEKYYPATLETEIQV